MTCCQCRFFGSKMAEKLTSIGSTNNSFLVSAKDTHLRDGDV
jgi:hypothetical protein